MDVLALLESVPLPDLPPPVKVSVPLVPRRDTVVALTKIDVKPIPTGSEWTFFYSDGTKTTTRNALHAEQMSREFFAKR